MGKAHRARAGSLMVWPRKRAKRSYSRLRNMSLKALKSKDAKPLCFAGYKTGMTHVQVIDNRPKSLTKGTAINFPVTVIECPPLKIISIRLYKRDALGMHVATDIMSSKNDKDLSRKIDVPKKANHYKKIAEIEPKIQDYADVRVVAHTQPGLTGFGKKIPDVFELAIGGNIKEKFAWAKDHLGKEVPAEQVFSAGNLVDVHGITKGKGFQGPVKRFGVTIRQHKSEKTKRGPAQLGSWTPHHVGHEQAHAGQIGFHQRSDYNRLIIKISNKPEEVNPKGGFVRYGFLKNSFMLIRGSVPGPAKRLVMMSIPTRPDKLVPKEPPTIEHISTDSKQRR